ncbi:MAG: ABC transporter transmembrane domain-containing protein [Candidatus Brocadiia bacterium]
MQLKHPLPNAVEQKLRQVVGEARPRVALRADIGPDGRFGEEWLVVAAERVLTLAVAEGAESGAEATVRRDFPLADISEVKIDNLVGAGSLQAIVRGQPVDMVRFSNAQARDFGAAARALDKLVKEGRLPEDTGEDEERFCPKCGRPLLEYSKVCPFCVSMGRTIWRLVRYLRPYAWRVAAILVLMGLSAGTMLVMPYLSKRIIDDVLLGPAEAAWKLFPLFLGLAAAHVATTGIMMLHGRLSAFVGHNVLFDLRAELYKQLQYLSLRYYDRRQVGSVMTRVSHDTGELMHFIVDAVPWTIMSILTLLAVGVRMVSKSAWLTLWIVVPVPLLVLATRLLLPRLFTLLRRFFERRARMSAVLNDSLSGIRVVKAFGQEDTEIQRFDARSNDLRGAGVHVDRMWMTVFPVLGLLSTAGGIIIYYAGGRAVLDGALSVGDFIEFTLLVQMFRRPVEVLIRVSHWISHALTSAERIFEIIDSEPDVREVPDPVPLERIEGQIELRDVTFGYEPHKPVLHGINLTIQPGEMVGLVGRSGAGKSTVINLICRLYDVDDGAVRIDGVDVRRLRLRDLHEQLGVVLQETFLFSGTVAENIAYGKPGASRLEILRAAKAANAHDFIVNFPDGYDTQVGERGSRLSGGEKQRVAIARAILNDPRILILDEATSAVDTQTERQIQQALERLTASRTTVAIAHRLSTLRNAHRLLVLDGGKQIELGTHHELMANKGRYYKLVNMQREVSAITAVGG